MSLFLSQSISINIITYTQNLQEKPSASSMKRKREDDRSISEEQKRPKGSMTSWCKASSKTGCIFEIGPPAWIKKEINMWAIKNRLVSTVTSLKMLEN